MASLEQLPLVRSIKETTDMWPDMSHSQKFGACVASIVTAMGPIGRIILEARQGKEQSATPGQLIAGIAVDLRDGLDGKIARGFDGITAFGKEFDPLADKADFLIQELFEHQRGNLPATHIIARFARDALVTGLRSHVMAVTDGQANVGANWWGKSSTLARQISNRITGLPFERDCPSLRAAHQTTATGLLLASGAINVKQLLDEKQRYLNK